MNARNEDGRTPLHIAVWESLEMTQLLLDSGALVNAQDCKGSTLLDGATESGHAEVADLLTQRGGRRTIRVLMEDNGHP